MARPIADKPRGLSLGDIYYILFRQKRIILTCTIVGLLAAAIALAFRRPVYESEAKLLIRYVKDSQTVNPTSGESQIRSPDEGGNGIINTEVEILRSFDLAEQVVDVVGIDKVMAGSPGDKNRDKAATLVSKNLTVDV